MQIYITSQGDTFDIIAKKFYSKEKYFTKIMEANPEFMHVVLFSSGQKLVIPDIEDVIEDDVPSADWRE